MLSLIGLALTAQKFFLRNNHLSGVPIRLVQNISQRLRAPLEIAEDTSPVAFFVVRRAGIGIRHTVPKRIVEQNGDLAGGGGDRLGFSRASRQAAIEGTQRGIGPPN